MKKMIIFGVMALALLLVACAPDVSDEEIQADLEELSDEELLEVATADEQAAVAGQAYSGPRLGRVKMEARKMLQVRMLSAAELQVRLVQAAQNGEDLKGAIGENGMPIVTFPATGERYVLSGKVGGVIQPAAPVRIDFSQQSAIALKGEFQRALTNNEEIVLGVREGKPTISFPDGTRAAGCCDTNTHSCYWAGDYGCYCSGC